MIKKLVYLVMLSCFVSSCGMEKGNMFTQAPTIEEISSSDSEHNIESMGGSLVIVEEKSDGSVVKFYKVTDNTGEEHTLVSVFEPLL